MTSGWSYRVSAHALEDLDGIDARAMSYGGEVYANELASRFTTAFEDLLVFPHAHPVYDFAERLRTLHEYRSVNVSRYKVFYWIDEDNRFVNIYRVLHAQSDFTRARF